MGLARIKAGGSPAVSIILVSPDCGLSMLAYPNLKQTILQRVDHIPEQHLQHVCLLLVLQHQPTICICPTALRHLPVGRGAWQPRVAGTVGHTTAGWLRQNWSSATVFGIARRYGPVGRRPSYTPGILLFLLPVSASRSGAQG
ncbi:uncharacterized [Tachysurus ichikawai]